MAALQEQHSHLASQIRLLPIEVNDAGRGVHFAGTPPRKVLRGAPVLLFDGAVHSGNMMARCAREVLRHQPADLLTYSLTIKRGSAFIPILWGLMIEESDRAYFLLQRIPNNRMDAGNRPQPFVHLQKLNEEMVNDEPIRSGVKSIDRMTWADRLYQMQTTDSAACTYLLKRGAESVGFLTLHFSAQVLFIDEIVVKKEDRGQGYAGILLRLGETMARQAGCRSIRLNAIEKRKEVYMGFKHLPLPGASTLTLGSEQYHPLEKAVLYHHSPLLT
jgi:ribosomal protein S18 acetylase RimI-like enzyme